MCVTRADDDGVIDEHEIEEMRNDLGVVEGDVGEHVKRLMKRAEG